MLEILVKSVEQAGASQIGMRQVRGLMLAALDEWKSKHSKLGSINYVLPEVIALERTDLQQYEGQQLILGTSIHGPFLIGIPVSFKQCIEVACGDSLTQVFSAFTAASAICSRYMVRLSPLLVPRKNVEQNFWKTDFSVEVNAASFDCKLYLTSALISALKRQSLEISIQDLPEFLLNERVGTRLSLSLPCSSLMFTNSVVPGGQIALGTTNLNATLHVGSKQTALHSRAAILENNKLVLNGE
ncbi:hypothetical protein JNK13_11415 [bacterium]|nr:hypothetical protein [bacterium]